MHYDLMESGKRIRTLRNQSGMSQERLGAVLGMTQSNVANIESGKYGIGIDTMALLAEYFDISLDYLVFGRINNELPLPIPPEKKAAVMNILRAILENI